MRLIGEALRLSASDLMRFKGCRHATTMDLRRIEIGDIRPGQDGAEALLLQRQGDEHELAFLDSLKTDGRLIVEIPKEGLPLEESVRLTHEAMAAGPDVIFQGALLDGAWGGYTDFLERVDRPSALGGWSYEVVDTKLKRKPDPKHVLQLCLYSDLLAIVQGVAPEAAHLELGDGSRFTVKLSEVSAYARYARRMLEAFLVERPETQPEPVSACALCSWSETCADRWATEDSLALVAGISRSQRQKLEAVGVVTMAGLAAREDRVPRMPAETQRRLVTQARLQSARRAGGPATFELREAEPGKGFGIMPAPDDGDIFYDIEGDPYYPGGLEYLHGLWYREAGEWVFRAFWAHTRKDEGGAVSELLGFLVDHMRRHPSAHIYHYANYEIAALRRLTSQHRTGEAAMDQLQRERRFVDLFKVVSGSLIASEKGYSIKDLEAFYMEKRAADVSSAGASVVFYEEWRQTGEQRLLDEIHDYNRTDCISTQLLRDWLVREVRPGAMAWPALGEVPDSGSLSNVAAEEEEISLLRARLEPVRVRLPEDVNLRSIDHDAGTLVLRRSTAKGPLPDRLDLLPPKPLRNSILRDAVATVTEMVIAGSSQLSAVEHLLSRSAPVFLDGHRPNGIIPEDGDLALDTSRAIAAMAGTTLAIQGPPGTGKTYVSALSIIDLVRAGKRVAVSSNSHKAIGNLLEAVADRVGAVAADDGEVRWRKAVASGARGPVGM